MIPSNLLVSLRINFTVRLLTSFIQLSYFGAKEALYLWEPDALLTRVIVD